MIPETPTPYPSPEITHYPEYPPTLMDLEIRPVELARQIERVSILHHHRTPYLHYVDILGGIVRMTENQAQILSDLITPVLPSEGNTPELIDYMLLSAIHNNGLTGVVDGLYNPRIRTIVIFPDATTLTSIITAAIALDRYNQRISTDKILHLVKDDISSQLARALNHEIVHSSQHELDIMRKVRPVIPAILWKRLKNHYHERAINLEDNPELLRYARQSISPIPIISDTQLLELYDLARDRYRLLRGDHTNDF